MKRNRAKPAVPSFDVEKILEDAALRGWMRTDLARQAGLADPTLSEFLNRKRQTPKTAAKIASALGYSIRRYLISARSKVAS